jgi:hypothetical protein
MFREVAQTRKPLANLENRAARGKEQRGLRQSGAGSSGMIFWCCRFFAVAPKILVTFKKLENVQRRGWTLKTFDRQSLLTLAEFGECRSLLKTS